MPNAYFSTTAFRDEFSQFLNLASEGENANLSFIAKCFVDADIQSRQVLSTNDGDIYAAHLVLNDIEKIVLSPLFLPNLRTGRVIILERSQERLFHKGQSEPSGFQKGVGRPDNPPAFTSKQLKVAICQLMTLLHSRSTAQPSELVRKLSKKLMAEIRRQDRTYTVTKGGERWAQVISDKRGALVARIGWQPRFSVTHRVLSPEYIETLSQRRERISDLESCLIVQEKAHMQHWALCLHPIFYRLMSQRILIWRLNRKARREIRNHQRICLADVVGEELGMQLP